MDDFIIEKRKQLLEHEHPLNLIDLWSEQLKHEEEYEEDEEENEDELIAKQAFRCLCFRCKEEINWFHRYYYTCSQCDHSIHEFCMEFPETLDDTFHAHTLYLGLSLYSRFSSGWSCNICHSRYNYDNYDILHYYCNRCDFLVDICCATKCLKKNIIHHPSHTHLLTCIPKQILSLCDACGKEHKGFFYHCNICPGPFIHSHCAFLPKKLQIQQTTNDFFFHIHPLTIAYSFLEEDPYSTLASSCRVCLQEFRNPNLWIYKCEKCRYYTHLDCATSRNEPFMSILAAPDAGKTIKNYKDVEHPDVVRLPFPDPSYSILKHWFFKEDGSSKFEVNKDTVNSRISHQHPLILEDARCTDITSSTPSRIKRISYHDPMKRTELLCNGCLRPITTTPIYVCADEDEHCNFVLHEWCSRLPTEVKDHQGHPQHTLILHSKAPGKFFGLFDCDICDLPCNGFVYCCEECEYYIDVNCAFLPKEITHTYHPNHLLSRVYYNSYKRYLCRMCGPSNEHRRRVSFSCYNCDFHLHPVCALLIPETTTHKCDKHPMKLSFLPIENHKIEYFCEICEEDLNPNRPFYHCHECMQSIHFACAPSIVRYETCPLPYNNYSVYRFVNVKFGGTYSNTKMHPHPLSFVQGVESDGTCDKCGYHLRYEMIFKCLDCKFAIHIHCCRRLVN